jgi:hypothetical protein
MDKARKFDIDGARVDPVTPADFGSEEFLETKARNATA